jgi:Ice-binding-like
MSEITISWDPPPANVSAFNVYRGTAQGNEAPTPYAQFVPVPTPVSLSAVSAPDADGNVTYTGNIIGGAGNALAGVNFVVTGFGQAANRGTYMCVASTATTLVLKNTAGLAETNVGSALSYPHFVDSGVLPGQVYSYEITALSGGVESLDSLGILSPAVPYPPTPARVFMGKMGSFAILAGSAITNVGTTTANGDVGVSPGTSITGFGPPSAIQGVFHTGDFVAAAAQAALTSAYVDAQGRTGAVTIPADIGGLTLGPGVYNVASSLAITGTLRLDAGGNKDATWIFQIGSTLTTASDNSSVELLNGAQASNVIWAVGSSATLTGTSSFAGTILAQASITVGTTVNVNGRLLARTGAVTLIDDSVTLFISSEIAFYGSQAQFNLGSVIFDCATQTYQQVIVEGVTAPTRPAFSPTIGGTTQDGTVLWITLDPPVASILTPISASPPNVPPAPPAAPTHPRIASEL